METLQTQTRPGLSGTALKLAACITMLIDHIGASCIEATYGVAYRTPPQIVQLDLVLRLIGRLAFPIFCFLLVEGFLHTTFPYDVNMENMSAEAKTFTDAWKKNFPNKDPNVNSALGYNCYNIILDALTRAGKADTEALTAALAATKNLPTALGVLSINETHDAEMPVGIIKYMDGKRKYIGDAIAE